MSDRPLIGEPWEAMKDVPVGVFVVVFDADGNRIAGRVVSFDEANYTVTFMNFKDEVVSARFNPQPEKPPIPCLPMSGR
jgi:hypothetical protein